jgi:ATP-binding cassette, subfamily B, bacterial IrtA/YbtP
MKEENWLKTVLSFSKPCRARMILSVFCACLSVAGGIVPYIGVYRIIVMFFTGSQTAHGIWLWSGICLAGYVLKLLFYAASTVLAHISAYTILEGMRLRLAQRLMKAPLGTVLNQTIGKLKSILIDRVETIELPLAHLIPEGFSEFLLSAGVFVYMVFIDWRMALAAMATVPIAGVAYSIVMKNYNRKYDSYMEASNHVNSVIVEYTEGIEVIKAFNQTTASYEKYENAVRSFREYTLDWFRSTWKLMNFGASVLPSTMLCAMPVGMYLYSQGALTPAELVMCLILSLGVVGSLTKFTVFINDLKSIQFAVRDVRETLNLPELANCETPVQLQNYDITLQNVSFSYETQNGAEHGKCVLNDVNLKIPQGTFAAIVGPSGGGKSTIARLCARFWDVDSGAITIGGVNIRQMPLAQLADMISFVTQDNFLFNCSLMENIRLGNPQASDAEVYAAAKAASCDAFIRALPNGYATTAGEAGGRLSGGEKQRIAIARAILKNAPIVILDEATAFTDPENEDKIQQSIAVLTREKTLLVIAHRLSTIKNADQIIVIDQGNIVQTGTHNELLSACTLYQNMWDAHIGAKAWAAGKEGKADV